MSNKNTRDMAQVHNALDRFWRELPGEYAIGSEQVDFMERFGEDPATMAGLTRLAIGNSHDPISDPVAAARELNISVGVIPKEVQDKIPARGVWFHDTPVMLVGESSTSPQFRHAVATEIGGLMVCRAAILANKSERQLNRLARKFADAFLYPDAAVQELKHLPSRQRFRDHVEDFGVQGITIIRRLSTVSRV